MNERQSLDGVVAYGDGADRRNKECMFSGIVEEAGTVVSLNKENRPYRLVIKTSLDLRDTQVGSSIAVEGVCLTIVTKKKGEISFDLAPETVRRSTLGALTAGSKVNLERSLKLGDRIHGHFVFGHVDATTRLLSRVSEGQQAEKLTFKTPPDLRRYLACKGSISLAGVSLTLGPVNSSTFCVYLIPHTLSITTLSTLQPGDKVNVEVDMLARYTVEQAVVSAGG